MSRILTAFLERLRHFTVGFFVVVSKIIKHWRKFVYRIRIVVFVGCKRVISPLTDTIFGRTKIHLSVLLKAMYILKVREPGILVKDLAVALNVSLPTVRSIKKRVMGLRKNAFELRVMTRLEPLIIENYTFIFNENPKQKVVE